MKTSMEHNVSTKEPSLKHHHPANVTHLHKPRFTEKRFIIIFIFVTSLFMLWGIAHSISDVLNKHFQNVLNVSKAQSGLIQMSVFGAYFFMSIPAGLFMKKFGYKPGVLLGLGLFAAGTFLFVPAANAASFGFFRIALFILGCGMATLETVAHPFAAVLGDQRTSDQRVNFAQSFNAVGAIIGPAIGTYFLLHATGGAGDHNLDSIKTLYVGLGIFISLVAAAFFMIKVPSLAIANNHNTEADNIDNEPAKPLIRHRHFVWAAIAQFFNVAAQAGTWGYFINYGHEVMGFSDEKAGSFMVLFMIMMALGRFTGTWLMRFIAPNKLLAAFALGSITACIIVAQKWGWLSYSALFSINFFFSIMFPTIFSLGLKNLGKRTNQASSYISMGVVGGAVMPYFMGMIANKDVAEAYYLPVLCYVVIFLFAARFYKPKHIFAVTLALITTGATAFCQHQYKGPDYAAKVNTLIGNKGKGVSETELQFEAGFTDPGAAYPLGMVQFTPTFFAPHKGFVVNQLSGAGCPNMGNYPTLPLLGELRQSPNTMDNLNPAMTTQKAIAGLYQVKLSSDIECRLTVTKRTGMAQFSFPAKENRGTIVIGSGINATTMKDAHIRITSSTSCEGYADGGSFCGSPTPYRIYFVAAFDRKAISSGTWAGNQLMASANTAGGPNSGAYFTFNLTSGKTVNYKFAVSYVSIANARENLAKENPAFDFDKVVAQTNTAWNNYLGKIEASGGSEDRTTQFYTHLYHALIHPSIFNDVNGDYLGSDNKVYKTSGFNYYTAFSNWDTYRTQIQLLSILAPKETSDIVTSHLLFAERSGGSFPRWVLANYETGIMQGDPSSILVANAYAFGARSFDTQKALTIMRKGAEAPGSQSQTIETRPHLAQYLEKGYMNASMQLEYTSADFAIGQFALQAFNNKPLYNTYLKRAQLWKNLYNANTTWLNSRNENGSWKNFNDDWREATYNSYFWMVPYNLKSLIDTIGGKKAAEKRLDSLFTKLNATYYQDWFAAGNEPDFQAPWSYNWAGAPYKTQALVQRIIKEQYSNRDNGLPGNDDLGAMGAWYVFANMGMFPMIPGYGGFSINSPSFPNIVVHLAGGKKIRINGGSETRPYINKLTVNGSTRNSSWISWKELSNGSQLEFILSAQPNVEWGTKQEPPSFN